MGTISTEAWTLSSAARHPDRGELVREQFTFSDAGANEVMAKPIYGCLEGNMLHALMRDPIDICQARKEAVVVVGNSGL